MLHRSKYCLDIFGRGRRGLRGRRLRRCDPNVFSVS